MRSVAVRIAHSWRCYNRSRQLSDSSITQFKLCGYSNFTYSCTFGQPLCQHRTIAEWLCHPMADRHNVNTDDTFNDSLGLRCAGVSAGTTLLSITVCNTSPSAKIVALLRSRKQLFATGEWIVLKTELL